MQGAGRAAKRINPPKEPCLNLPALQLHCRVNGPSHLPPPSRDPGGCCRDSPAPGLLSQHGCAPPDVRAVKVGSVSDRAVGYILSASLALGRPSVGLALLLPLYGRQHHMLRGSQLSAWQKGRRRWRGEKGEKKIKRIFIMKETEREFPSVKPTCQKSPPEPNFPRSPPVIAAPSSPFHVLCKASRHARLALIPLPRCRSR